MSEAERLRINTEREPFVKVTVIARFLGVNPATVYRWAIKGKIPSHALGPRTRRFRLSEVERSICEQS